MQKKVFDIQCIQYPSSLPMRKASFLVYQLSFKMPYNMALQLTKHPYHKELLALLYAKLPIPFGYPCFQKGLSNGLDDNQSLNSSYFTYLIVVSFSLTFITVCPLLRP